MLADAIVEATWGLVAATALLVVATTIPVALTIRERWVRLATHAAQVIPPMHLLLSRTEGLAKDLDEGEPFEEAVDDLNGQLDILAEILSDSQSLGLRFVGELFISRHLLTQARIRCETARQVRGTSAGTRVEAVIHLQAAIETLREAECLVPRRKLRTGFHREDFWGRFTRLSDERVRRHSPTDSLE